MKKNILFVIDSLGCGGAEKSLISLLPLLDKKRYNIDLMIVSRGGIFEQYIPEVINIIDYQPTTNPLSNLIFRFFQLLLSVKLRIYKFFKIKRHGAEIHWSIMQFAIKKFDKEYDTAIAYQQGFPTYYVANKIASKNKIAWINVNLIAAGYSKSFNDKFYQSFNSIVCVSDSLTEIIKKEYDKPNITTIYDILNPDLINKLAIENNYKQYSPIKVHITTTARLSREKGYNLAIDAARILKEKNINFVWHFVGGGSLKSQIEVLINDNNLNNHIVLVGETPNPYPYMKSCDIYVQPSLFEGFGLTIAEAKILHKPIVSTNFDVVHNQLKNDFNGLIVNKNGAEIADAIIRLINDVKLREFLITNLKSEINQTQITEPQKIMEII